MSHENVQPQVIAELLRQLHRQHPASLLNSCGPSRLHQDASEGQSGPAIPNWLKERRVTLPNALDPTEIHAVVRGPELSPYARGFFTVKLFIEAEFPRLPPRVVFSTRVFHPNVCEVTGDVCKIALRRVWCSEDWDLERFLNGLVDLMERPFLDKPLNMTAARLFSAERDGFYRRARLCTVLHALPRSLTPVKRRRTSSSTTSDYCGFADLDPLVGNACYEDVADGLVPMAPLAHVGLSLDPIEATEVLSCSNSDSPSTPCAMSVDGESEPGEAPRRRVPLEIVVDDDYGSSSSSDDSEDGRDIVVDGMATPQRGCGRCSPSAEPRSTGKLANTPKGGLFEHDSSPLLGSARVRSTRHCTTPRSPFLGTPVRAKKDISSLRRL
ncbi:ubiquitin-conjugating enzyme E2 S [Perkinsus olseni]|uniref:Ubiquitin-conjugating enzyme E2 S n=1 Tax=Perkinsus olseni TaxID=32597 RepID=A0A7J6UGY2_PEROL|nr:ubiquitin-conjugating enzyme E2 S [Perkinsus olseni]